MLSVHSCDVIHRDIKPENILVDAKLSKAKISDFGEAQVGKEITTTAGTPAFWAPELFSTLGSD